MWRSAHLNNVFNASTPLYPRLSHLCLEGYFLQEDGTDFPSRLSTELCSPSSTFSPCISLWSYVTTKITSLSLSRKRLILSIDCKPWTPFPMSSCVILSSSLCLCALGLVHSGFIRSTNSHFYLMSKRPLSPSCSPTPVIGNHCHFLSSQSECRVTSGACLNSRFFTLVCVVNASGTDEYVYSVCSLLGSCVP